LPDRCFVRKVVDVHDHALRIFEAAQRRIHRIGAIMRGERLAVRHNHDQHRHRVVSEAGLAAVLQQRRDRFEAFVDQRRVASAEVDGAEGLLQAGCVGHVLFEVEHHLCRHVVRDRRNPHSVLGDAVGSSVDKVGEHGFDQRACVTILPTPGRD